MQNMQTMRDTIRLTFLTNTDNRINVNIHRAGPAVSEAEVNQSMNEFISTQAFHTRDRGLLNRKLEAVHMQTSEFEYPNITQPTA